MCRFFGFKSCTIMVFMILLKQMLSANQIAGFLNSKTNTSKLISQKTIGRIK